MQTCIRPSLQSVCYNVLDSVLQTAETPRSPPALNANAATLPQGTPGPCRPAVPAGTRRLPAPSSDQPCPAPSRTARGRTSLLQPRGSRDFSVNYRNPLCSSEGQALLPGAAPGAAHTGAPAPHQATACSPMARMPRRQPALGSRMPRGRPQGTGAGRSAGTGLARTPGRAQPRGTGDCPTCSARIPATPPRPFSPADWPAPERHVTCFSPSPPPLNNQPAAIGCVGWPLP